MSHRLAKKNQRPKVETSQREAQPVNYGYTETQHQNHQPKSDPKQLPRPLLQSVDSIYTHDKSSYKKGKLAFPQAQSLFISSNTYDAGPDFVRPTSAVMLGNPKKTQFPFGAWITPFGSQNVHTVRAKAPLRCGRCKAYINAYFRFDGTKSSAICNICGITFQVDQSTDPMNLNSPELSTEGIIDFVVQDKRFMRKRLDIIKIVLAIEFSSFFSESGAFENIIQSAKAAVQNTNFQSKIRIGVVFYNYEGITYLKLKNSEKWSESPPRKYTVKYSTQGLCNPLSDAEMFLDPNEDKEKLLYLLDYVSQIGDDFYRNSKYATFGANYAATLKSLLNNFEAQTGRIVLFSNIPPKSGPFAIRPRNVQDSKNPLKPLGPQYFELGKKFLESKVGIDMFVIGKQQIIQQQFPTVHYLCSLTGGSLKFYCPYSSQNHGENLYYEIYGSLTRKYVYDVDFTARVSNGLNIYSYGAYEGIRETRDVSLSIMDPSSSVMFTFEHEQKIQQSNAAFLQYAMMFTDGNGERRIRIINYRYFITNKISVLHEACDYLAVSNIILRQALSKMCKTQPSKIREEVINRLINIVAEYAQENRSGISRGSQFMAHPNFAPAFAYIHSVINSKLFINYDKISADYRIYEMLKLNKLNFGQFANYYYPKLYSLGLEIYEKEPIPGEPIEGEQDIEQSCVLPPNLPLNHESLSKDGVYLHVNSVFIIILVMPEASEQLLAEIFGTDNWDEIEQNGLPELETAHNIRINIMLEQIRRRNTSYNGIYLPVMARTPKKKHIFNEMVNFITKQDIIEFKYFAFLDVIHRQVQTRLK